jgi:phosphoglycolate phosphatase-like HAD superfamily hydrolase
VAQRRTDEAFDFGSVDTVISDIDGTLVDSVDAHAASWQSAFARAGFAFDYREIRSQVGKGADQLLPEFLTGAQIHRVGKRATDDHDHIFDGEYKSTIRAFPGVRDLFVELKRQRKTTILATSGGRGDAEFFIGVAGIADVVDSVVTSEDVEQSKPQPDLLHLALAKSATRDPRRTVMIGDSPWDAEGARRAGIRAIGLLCGGFPREDLRHAGCVAIFDDIATLLRAVRG